jgi:small subunit ribosomal protein S7
MRKRKPKKRVIQPDPRFGDELVTKFVNNLMWRGKKSVAFAIFYDAMDKIADRTGEDAHEVWKKALGNVTPSVEVRSRRIGGATFQIPTEIRPARKTAIGMKWLIRFARARSGKGMAEKLSAEIIAASKNEGAAVKRKEDTHKMAESNRAFAHFRA